ncbi:MAG: restriction endonuclease [Bacteroidetes bacterium]|nr:restriction endonuclease [Bacteroidota bacterium]
MFFTSRNRTLVANVKKLEALEKNVIALNQENKELINIIDAREKALQQIISEKSKGFPWLADAIAEFYKYQDFEIASYLTFKKHPAYKKADAVREVALDNKLLRKQIKIAQNFVNYYETLFPWINEYVGEDLDDLLESIAQSEKQDSKEEADPVLKFIPRAEYEKLPPSERNQKALDRYLSSRKKSYEIGRDYERYIGYLYESEGFKVEYMGIEKGLEDLGRDLICVKGDEINIVQCKCWASHKTVHEKHINQLYGTAVKYFIDHRQLISNKKSLTLFPDLISSGQIKATFVTSTKLSDTAKKFADALGIKVIQEKQLEKYPVIKCNIASNGEKIYHLPFDQQYDKTLIKYQGEFYAATVKEAESRGFRRAFRWRGTTNTE